ncbi:tRNA-(guanine-N1)-methyltransferase [Elusimicrobium minutum Pei191]|uniref:tRNA (guanine-N(1)-)-methyltransferase n=1 Tax=Elusimicrobium minutum (strain Pei191) TaxID=445932 RepID=B2KCP9_ELUMP|nr:tRNA (guanosine(37)-N1)-methyltransferase TrmD [Elusimicrobium minutum]ACC98295.1 tRNA-(guanine-N1)-methyltransferase [Elusimicrobium minutum Pei191]
MSIKIDVVTPFPDIVDGPLGQSIPGRARKEKILNLGFCNPRDFVKDKHKSIDDRVYGGGAGMLMKAEPLYQAIKKLRKKGSVVIYTSPRGKVFNQTLAKKLSLKKHLIFVCGHYEGVDARIYPEFDLEVSLGDFILTGGESAAVVMIDAITRLLPGVFKKSGVTELESFENNLLEPPQYTRPEVWRRKRVPAVLLSGNHKEIETWKQKEAVKITKKFRPDLLPTSEKRTSLKAKKAK